MRPAPAVRAICHRCGSAKKGPFVPCKACAVVPTRESRAVAWLLSSHHLNAEELDDAARRIRAGDVPDPPRALRDDARRAMGAVNAPPVDDRRLVGMERVGLALASVLLTPLIGLALWLGLREARPTAARQVIAVTIPIAVILTVIWMVDHLV